MQTNVRVNGGDEQVFDYDRENGTVLNWIGEEPVSAVQGTLLERQYDPKSLRVVCGDQGGSRHHEHSGRSVLKSLRIVVILGMITILLLGAYSVGVSNSSSRARLSADNSLSGGSYLSYTVKPGDSAWSIASAIAAKPSLVPSVASEIIYLEGSSTLLPGTVLNLKN